MNNIHISPEIPPEISQGLEAGRFERIGGAILDVASKELVAWLREAYGTEAKNLIPEITAIAAGPNVCAFNLAISTMGFAVVMKHLNTIEAELRRTQELLNVINYKIDVSFYANFRAAVDLAANSFRMANAETRKTSALQAIDRLLLAKHHYLSLADVEVENGSPVADDFLSTVSLAYIAEARCYLELGEIETARLRLIEGQTELRPRYSKHIRTLLTSNPAAYLHPSVYDEISLGRLTKVFQWFDSKINENALFQAQRRNLFELARQPKKWIDSLPQAVFIPKRGLIDQLKLTDWPKNLRDFLSPEDFKNRALALPWLNRDRKDEQKVQNSQNDSDAIFRRLPQCLDLIETMIENFRRFEGYHREVQTMQRLGIGFKEWIELAPETRGPSEHPLMWIVVGNQQRPM